MGNEGDNDEEGIKGLQDSGDIILKKLEDSKQQILDHSVKTLKLIDRKSSSILDRIEKDKQKLLSGGLDNVNIL